MSQPADTIAPRQPQAAWVVFTDETSVWWLRGLRRGFRHCFVILHDGVNWLSIDPLLTRLCVMNHPCGDNLHLPNYLKAKGYTVIPAQIHTSLPRVMRPDLFTCVSVARRVLGLQAPGVWTPWQLYRFLQNSPLPTRLDGDMT